MPLITALVSVAAANRSNRLLGDVLPVLIVLIAVVLVGGVAIYFIRRSLRADDSSLSEGFTLYDLRKLHAAGELTDDEFERAKAQMIGRLKGPAKAADTAQSAAEDHPESPSPGNHGQSSE